MNATQWAPWIERSNCTEHGPDTVEQWNRPRTSEEIAGRNVPALEKTLNDFWKYSAQDLIDTITALADSRHEIKNHISESGYATLIEYLRHTREAGKIALQLANDPSWCDADAATQLLSHDARTFTQSVDLEPAESSYDAFVLIECYLRDFLKNLRSYIAFAVSERLMGYTEFDVRTPWPGPQPAAGKYYGKRHSDTELEQLIMHTYKNANLTVWRLGGILA